MYVCMYVCVYIYIYIYIHTYVYTHTYIRITCTHWYTRACARARAQGVRPRREAAPLLRGQGPYAYIHIYIYTYIYIYLYIHWSIFLREYLSMGCGLWFSTGANGRKRFSTNTYRNIDLFLHKSPKVFGSLREFTGKCNPGILHSVYLLCLHPQSVVLPALIPVSEKKTLLRRRIYMGKQ